jgi:hypothetical protein
MSERKAPQHVLLAAALAAAGIISAAPAVAQQPTTPPEGGDGAISKAPSPATTPADVLAPDRFVREHRFDVVPSLVAARFPDRFGGAYIDRETGGDPVLHVRVKELSAKERAALDTEIADPAIVVEASDFSRLELDAAQDRVEEELKARGLRFSTALDLEHGLVDVQVLEADLPRVEGIVEARNRAIEDPRLAGRLRLGVDPSLAEINFVEADNQFPPMRGGKPIDIGFIGYEGCTSGFSIWNEAFGYFGTTAGHCGAQGNLVRMTGTNIPVSSVAADFAPSSGTTNTDAMTFSLSAADATSTIRNDGGTTRPVWWKLADASLTNTLQLCKVGVDTGTTCGPITDVGKTLSDGTLTVTGSVCMQAFTDFGDSGGPVEQPRDGGGVWAAGLISAQWGSKTCFTTIDRVLATAYSQLVIQPK